MSTQPASPGDASGKRPDNDHIHPDDARVHDVLIVGGGPSGSACAYWLAEAGWDVALVEKKVFPREKTCGDGLTPRAVRQIADMGLEASLTGAHRYSGLRAHAYGKVLDLPWPEHPSFPSYGYVITRHDLDQIINERAEKAGAAVWQGTEAIAPILADGPIGTGSRPVVGSSTGAAGTPAPPDRGAPSSLPACVGAVVKSKESGETREIRARYVVVADGANSRFGRMLGTGRNRNHPMGMALRGYYRSPGHDETFIESHLDIRDSDRNVVPGYGWIFPLGDGRVNVGVGLLSTDRRWKGVNTSHLMDAFVAWAPKAWELSPETCLGPPTGGKLPMGLSVGPHRGPTTLVIGDAGGSINPFNGEGIAYGYETGRLAAASLGEALSGDGELALARYEQRLEDAYGLYYRVARAFIKMISQPELMKLCVATGMHSESIMSWLLRIMANLLRPDELGPAEAAYRAFALVARAWPEPAA
ncbi:MAG TPA: geranylgeranyl reductase family protein [Acidimicrobiales bacterium]|nr:geranylgeranyl reductase family protein [Acidimicrobiales bacterium]